MLLPYPCRTVNSVFVETICTDHVIVVVFQLTLFLGQTKLLLELSSVNKDMRWGRHIKDKSCSKFSGFGNFFVNCTSGCSL